MTNERPVPTGTYEVVQDFECPSASVRVLRLSGPRESIDQHVHRRSMQIYVSLGGRAVVTVDGDERILEPYEAVAIWPGSAHGASPESGEALLLNISVPPLARNDQIPLQPPMEFPDLALPTREEDVND